MCKKKLTAIEFKQKRQELKLTQKELAIDLGLSKENGDRYIREIESGKKEPSGLLLRCFQLIQLINPNNKGSDE
jgi:DNA-binding transcriptional regulator YiaG